MNNHTAILAARHVSIVASGLDVTCVEGDLWSDGDPLDGMWVPGMSAPRVFGDDFGRRPIGIGTG